MPTHRITPQTTPEQDLEALRYMRQQPRELYNDGLNEVLQKYGNVNHFYQALNRQHAEHRPPATPERGAPRQLEGIEAIRRGITDVGNFFSGIGASPRPDEPYVQTPQRRMRATQDEMGRLAEEEYNPRSDTPEAQQAQEIIALLVPMGIPVTTATRLTAIASGTVGASPAAVASARATIQAALSGAGAGSMVRYAAPVGGGRAAGRVSAEQAATAQALRRGGIAGAAGSSGILVAQRMGGDPPMGELSEFQPDPVPAELGPRGGILRAYDDEELGIGLGVEQALAPQIGEPTDLLPAHMRWRTDDEGFLPSEPGEPIPGEDPALRQSPRAERAPWSDAIRNALIRGGLSMAAVDEPGFLRALAIGGLEGFDEYQATHAREAAAQAAARDAAFKEREISVKERDAETQAILRTAQAEKAQAEVDQIIADWEHKQIWGGVEPTTQMRNFMALLRLGHGPEEALARAGLQERLSDEQKIILGGLSDILSAQFAMGGSPAIRELSEEAATVLQDILQQLRGNKSLFKGTPPRRVVRAEDGSFVIED